MIVLASLVLNLGGRFTTGGQATLLNDTVESDIFLNSSICFS